MTLGCLLGMRLFMIGASERLVSGQAERELSDWMAANAGVAWVVTDQPGVLEQNLLREFPLPLNLELNRHPFGPRLKEIRAQARDLARNSVGGTE